MKLSLKKSALKSLQANSILSPKMTPNVAGGWQSIYVNCGTNGCKTLSSPELGQICPINPNPSGPNGGC
ncbi:hypothetical protein ACSLBF_12640 [Pseudoalteromonas sp. T1lg65]|uniref:hypothetical protein n=1 Tax=Pseudoalteromonas sp. T1lg65 TaxID=2077101 RepID=UPI003F7B0E44